MCCSIKTLKDSFTQNILSMLLPLIPLRSLPAFNSFSFLSLCLQNKQIKLKTNKTPMKHTHIKQKTNKIKSFQTKKYDIKVLQKRNWDSWEWSLPWRETLLEEITFHYKKVFIVDSFLVRRYWSRFVLICVVHSITITPNSPL